VGERVILDASLLIDGERDRLDVSAAVDEDDDAVVPAIAVAEFLVGVRLAVTEGQRYERQAFLDGVLAAASVVDYTREVAERHAELLAHVRRAGTTRGAHDLIVAATAVATKRTVVTTDDRARFGELPGVAVRVVPRIV
jgi:tRNA(fMet)-specific endonuclease VapC